MLRRFVNILAEKGSTGAYSLHRLDVTKHLFYPSTAEAVAAKPAIERLGQLPEPCVSFQPSPATTLPDSPRLQWFALLSPRSGEGRILYGNTTGNIALYDADANSIQCMPAITGPKGFMPITMSVARPGAPEEDLYVMHPIPAMGGPCFDVLRFGMYMGEVVRRSSGRGDGWHWDSLPPTPLATLIGAHAVLDGGRTICVSAAPRHMGTYCFDTVRGEWWQAADDWELPFDGGVEYVPDLKLWLGFASGTHQLCASSDLSAAAAAAAGAKPPTLKRVPGLDTTPTEWKSVATPKLLSLGSGRFCIAKVFQAARNTPSVGDFPDLAGERFAVLTGVEMRAGSGDNKPGVEMLGGSGDSKAEEDNQGQAEEEDNQGLQMVKHKSILYAFLDGNGRIDWVL